MTLERRIGIATDGYRGGDGGAPTTVTVVINGEIRQAGLEGTLEPGLVGSIGDRRLVATLSDDEFENTLKDNLDGQIDDQNLDGELK